MYPSYANRCLCYADESSTNERYFGAGVVLYFPESRDMESKAYEHLRAVKRKYGFGVRKDIHWANLPSKTDRYSACCMEYLDLFLKAKRLFFSCIVVDTQKYSLNSWLFYDRVKDKGIDSFMYYLLSRRVLLPLAGHVDKFVFRLDRRKRPAGITALQIRQRLRSYCRDEMAKPASILLRSCEGSRHPIIQMTDLLLGATMARWNGKAKSLVKLSMIEKLENGIGRPLNQVTPPKDRRFNVWAFETSLAPK